MKPLLVNTFHVHWGSSTTCEWRNLSGASEGFTEWYSHSCKYLSMREACNFAQSQPQAVLYMWVYYSFCCHTNHKLKVNASPPPPPPRVALVQANYVGASLVSTVHTCAQFPQLVGIPHSHCVTDPYTYIYYFRLLSLNRGCKLASFPGSPLCTHVLIASDELWTHVKIILRGSSVHETPVSKHIPCSLRFFNHLWMA